MSKGKETLEHMLETLARFVRERLIPSSPRSRSGST